VIENHSQDSRYKKMGDVCETVSAKYGTGGNNTPLVIKAATDAIPINDKATRYKGGGPTRNNDGSGNGLGVGKPGGPSSTLTAADRHAVACREEAPLCTNPLRWIVRRLTPVECERLQGFPDGWTDIGDWIDSKGKRRKTSDSARYRSLGNSIALPFWDWLLERISRSYERPATLGSLFDGIGGFPLCWERHNGAGTTLWASEIDEFCIAVTQRRFPSNEV
jgi:DNA (cytosine-5)-methyltransferase 1